MDREYFAVVERTFLEQRGGLMLSSACARLVLAWGRAAIPVEVVQDGIIAAFERPRARPIRNLADVRQDVEAAAERWRGRQVGQAAPAPAHLGDTLDGLRARFEALTGEADPVVRAVAREAVVSLRAFAELARGAALPEPIEMLASLAAQLADTALRVAQPADAARLRRAAPADDRARLWRAVREHYHLPALVIDVGGGW